MDFSTDSTLVKSSLRLTEEVQDGLLYFGGFAATLPAMGLSMGLLLRGHDRTAGLLMSVLIVGGAWLRWVAVTHASYAIAMISTVMLGLAGGVIFTSFTFLPERWFPGAPARPPLPNSRDCCLGRLALRAGARAARG